MIPRRLGVVRQHAIRSIHRSPHDSNPSRILRDELRELLRETAQPVAVVTSFMHPELRHGAHARFHGATLSSFSSIAMDPHPLVAFSLRVPSRMATSLTALHGSSSVAAHMVINILSAAQEPAAVQFSRPDLHPEPFTSTPYFLTKDGLPVLEGSLGALSCKLVAASWPLHDLEVLERQQKKSGTVWEGDGVASELFIAEVTRVEAVTISEDSEDGSRTLPLLYHRRAYATTCGIPPKHHPPSTNQKQ